MNGKHKTVDYEGNLCKSSLSRLVGNKISITHSTIFSLNIRQHQEINAQLDITRYTEEPLATIVLRGV